MQFKDIIGQERVTKALQNAVENKRVPHALMISGIDGNGHLPLAIAFSALLNCDAPVNGDSCGTCSSCSKHRQLIHPDLHLVFPTFNSGNRSSSNPATTNDFVKEFREMFKESIYCNEEDWKERIGSESKALNINVKQCRDMIKAMNYKAFEGKYKVMVVWLPEFLKEQGNILLKMIEEPAPQTVFILCTSKSDQILTTILSRTQLLKMEIPSLELIEEILIKEKEIEQGLANNIALLSESSLNRAFKLIHHMEDSQFAPLREWFLACFKGSVVEMNTRVNSLALKGREDLKSYLQYGLHVLRACILNPYQVNDTKLTPEEKGFVDKLSQYFNPKSGEKAYIAFNNALYWIERNGNVKIILFDLSLELKNIFKNK